MSSTLTDQAKDAFRQGDTAQAQSLAQRAVEAGDESAHAILARTLQQTGELGQAERHARLALYLEPDDAVTRAYLGAILLGNGMADEAVAEFRTAAEAQPGNVVLQNEYGNALAASGRFDEAEEALRRAVALRDDLPEIHNNLGNVLRGLGRLKEAEACYRTALALRADYAEALNNLGVVLQTLGDRSGAISAFRRSVALRPDNALVHTHLGAAFGAQGRLGDAVDAHREALRHEPGLAAAHNNLGIALKDQGLLAEAREAYEYALAAAPDDAGIHSNLLMCLSYDPVVDGDRLLEAHRDWAARHETPGPARFDSALQSDRVLRIGYISPDFWTHSVAYFIEPVLARHDRSRFHVTCYADVERPDDTTARLQALADQWRDTAALADEALAELVRADEIDILVDLAGHTGDNRLPLFGRRVAPVQITWIGYPATTGLSQMDYRITDHWADPPGDTDAYYSEALLRLPQGFLCYRPPEDCPPPDDDINRPLTFGSFNNLSKMTDQVIALWARLLRESPRTRLLLKSRQLADNGARHRIVSTFAQHGVAEGRLELRSRIAAATDHLALYGEMDVALDTFPYNGTTTTCEALWMGVPVVTLAGSLHAGRVGVSLLNQVGKPEWVAQSHEDYISIARALAAAPPDRDELRDSIARSALTDAASFTETLETELRSIWRRRCADANGPE